MDYIFECTIGPVQDFIASARRSRDLWYGSWLLSELSKAAAKALMDRFGIHCLIFPCPSTSIDLQHSSDFNVPNKIVAILVSPPEDIGMQVKKAIDLRLAELQDEAFSHVRGNIDKDLARRQIDDLVEFYWVMLPMQEDRYAETRKRAEALLASRKATRNFHQFQGAYIHKSSLDGSRESVIPGTGLEHSTRYHNYGARRGEQLSGVDLLKRLGQRNSAFEQKFKSTTDIAALPFLAHIDRVKGLEGSTKLLAAVQALLATQEIDLEDKGASILYRSRLQEWFPDDSALNDVYEQIVELIREYGGTSDPYSYYALLLADGDFMGKVIDSQTSVEKHQDFSRKLSTFAQSIGVIIQNYQGVPIYAGGDDVLAYVPIHRVLPCAMELADKFADELRSFKTDQNLTPTLSIGIALVHHLMPLGDALALVRNTEKAAKDVEGKNALAVTVSKRSGTDRTIAGKRTALQDRLQVMIDLLRRDAISKGVAYELHELHRIFYGTDIPSEAWQSEALRIIERKRESGGNKRPEEMILDTFRMWIDTDGIPLDQLAQELITAKVFAASLDIAEGPLNNQKDDA